MDTKEIQTKKDAPILERSVMLTRFKLSQQKRQLRDKDRVSLIPLKRPHSATKSGDGKKLPPQKATAKSNKEKQAKKFELYPNKLKRNKVVKKITLKPKNEFKVIGCTNAVKRKRRESEKTLTSPSVKRKRKNQRKISLDSSFSEADNRSQSPVYSELGFEEVIRMADENEYLNDEDLMEILTCPSPVWWEDPPDEEYREDPIVIKTNIIASFPDTLTQRSKQSRKRRPQKLIIEPAKCRVNDDILIKEELLNNKKPDDNFIKRRTKLEDLLNTIKSKGKLNKNCDEISTKLKKNYDVSSENKCSIDESVDAELELNPEHNCDSTFLDISLLDGIKHLENLEIPIENNNKAIDQRNKNIHLKSKIISNKHFKIIKNDKSRVMSKIKNKKLKILNVKNVSPGVLTLRSRKDIIQNTNQIKEKDVKASSFKSEKEANEINDSLNERNASLNERNASLNERNDSLNERNASLNERNDSLNERNNSLNERNDSLNDRNASLNDRNASLNERNASLNDRNASLNERNASLNEVSKDITQEITNDNEEYITVFEIINSDEDISSNEKKIKNDTKTETNPVTRVTDKNKLNTYYKKCKNSPRTSKKMTEIKKTKNLKNNEEILCDDCNSSDTIIVPNSNDIKYCLKCSSIFDADICSYCVKKEQKEK